MLPILSGIRINTSLNQIKKNRDAIVAAVTKILNPDNLIVIIYKIKLCKHFFI